MGIKTTLCSYQERFEMCRLNFDISPNCYLSEKTKINVLQRQVIVHSILYYELDCPIISDKEFDELSNQLLNIMNTTEVDLEETQYYYCLNDFDGNSGFDLYSRLNTFDKIHLNQIAIFLIHSTQKRSLSEIME